MVELLAEAAIVKPNLKAAFAVTRKAINAAIGRDVTEALTVYRVRVLTASLSQRVALAERVANGLTRIPLARPVRRSRSWLKKSWSSQMANNAVSIAHSRAVTTQDDWGNQKPEPAKPSEPMIRLSVDLAESLHTRLKLACVAKRQNMADEVRGLIERNVGAPG